jgi:hypothetical protein
VGDSWQALIKNRGDYQEKFHPALLNSPFWQRVANRYDKLVYVLPRDNAKNYIPLCYFAATHHLPINIGRWARIDEKKLETAQANLIQALERDRLAPRVLYVFEDVGLWQNRVLEMSLGDWAGVVDGFKIIAPAWDDEKRQDPMAAIRQAIPAYHFGARLRFVPNAEGANYLGYGWSQPEPQWGVWSEGDHASILLLLEQEPTSDILLQLEGFGFVNAKSPEQQIDVFVNSTGVGKIAYTQQNPEGSRSMRIPRNLLVGHRGLVEIRFEFKNDVSPERLGLGLDPRKLALGLKALALEPTEGSSSSSQKSDIHSGLDQ